MKVRRHRGTLAESMETVAEIEPTLEALVEHMKKYMAGWGVTVDPELVTVEDYGFDARINWNTYIVHIKGYGVFGFTDGPLENMTSEE